MSFDLSSVISISLFPEVWQSSNPRRIIYHGQMISLNEEEYKNFVESIPEFWHSDTDKLLNFRYLTDGTYFCERIKTVYNYATKEWSDVPYVFDSANDAQVKEFINIISLFYQNYKLLQIKNINDEILNNISDLSYLKMVLLNSRNKLLQDSDYMFNTDYKFKNNEIKQEWIDYRQKLRDITDQEAWKDNDYVNIEMPISPNPLKQVPELIAEMEAIVPPHFKGFLDDSNFTENVENIVTTMSQYMIKNQIIDGISKMALPLIDLKVGTFDINKSSENYDTFMNNFNEFKNKIDTQLQEIGSTLTVEKIIENMTEKTKLNEIGDEVFDIIEDLNKTAE